MAAKKDGLVVPITTDADELKKGFEQAAKIVQDGGKKLEKEAAKMALEVSKKIEKLSPKSQARQLETLTIKMMEMGMEGTKAFEMVAKSAGHLKANIDDAKGVIDAFRPDAPFQALSTTLTATAQGFAGVQGAMALFGSESEDLQKTLVKVQGALALAEGFKAIDGLTDGFAQLNLVIKANPLMAGAVAFTAIAAGIAAIALSSDGLTESQRQLAEATEKAFAATITEKTELNNLLRVYNDKKTTDEERLAIQKRLIDMNPEYLGGISAEKVEQDKVNAAVVNYIGLLEIKAKAQAYQEMYVEALKEEKKAHDALYGTTNKVLSNFVSLTGGSTYLEQKYRDVQTSVEGLKTEYEKLSLAALKAEDAQRNAFGKVETPSKTNAGVRTTKTKPAQKVSLIDEKEVRKQISALKSASIQGVKPYETAIEKATEKLEDFKQVQIQLSDVHLAKSAIALQKQAESLDLVYVAASSLNELIRNSLSNGIIGVAEAFGTAVANGEDAASAIGKAFLNSLADFVMQMGKMMITAAISWDAFQKSILANPIAAIAIGAVAVAAGAALKAHIANGSKPQKFAEGGIVAGTSYSGDRVHALVNSGEMILNHQQQSRLFNMLNTGGTNNGYIASTRIDGRDLYLVVEKAKKDMSR